MNHLTIGVVTPHSAPGPELELPAMTSGRVATIVCRTASAPRAAQASSHVGSPAHPELRASTEPAAIRRAMATFEHSELDAVVHASTTSGYVLGHRGEAAAVDRLSDRFGVPALASCAAAVAALRTHGIEQVQLVHPPWFDDELDRLGDAYFRGQGFDPVVTRAASLPGDPARVEPQHVLDWVEQHLQDRAEAVYLAGNGFRTAAAVAEVEAITGRLVIAANQALLWGVLEATGAHLEITGYGRLLHRGT